MPPCARSRAFKNESVYYTWEGLGGIYGQNSAFSDGSAKCHFRGIDRQPVAGTDTVKRAGQSIPDQCQSYLDACVKAFRFSGAMLIAKNGRKIWSGATGCASFELDVANTVKTKFRLASVTKQFTAMAILILHEDGKLDISKSVTRYVEHRPKHWKKITVHHLLTNTSGIPDYTGFPDHSVMAKHKITPAELVASFKDQELEYSPGERFKYTNSGYALLGAIIEAVSGQSYSEFLQERIFKPLAMKDSGVDDNEQILPGRACGYASTTDNKLRNATYLDMSVPYSAGSIYSTVQDLLLWDRGLANCSLISPATAEVMFKPNLEGYACGWFIKECDGRMSASHAGGIDGFSSNIERIPSEGFCSVVLSNIEGTPVGLIENDLRAIAFGQPYNLPRKYRAIKISPSVLSAYVGCYELSPGFIVTILQEGNKFYAQAPSQSKLQLLPKSETEFFISEIYAQITFCIDENNVVTHFVLHQNGNDQHAPRISRD
jgi:CubicO group peptidase (beta-lactamase class C family)